MQPTYGSIIICDNTYIDWKMSMVWCGGRDGRTYSAQTTPDTLVRNWRTSEEILQGLIRGICVMGVDAADKRDELLQLYIVCYGSRLMVTLWKSKITVVMDSKGSTLFRPWVLQNSSSPLRENHKSLDTSQALIVKQMLWGHNWVNTTWCHCSRSGTTLAKRGMKMSMN